MKMIIRYSSVFSETRSKCFAFHRAYSNEGVQYISGGFRIGFPMSQVDRLFKWCSLCFAQNEN